MDEVRIGVVGGGNIAKAHVIAARSLRSYFGADGRTAEVVAVADADPETARQAADDYSIARWTADWETIVESDDIDAVTVAVPNDLHEPVAVAAAQAGKHVLCEKPLAHDVESARRMLAAVEGAGVVHSVDLNYRSIPAIRYARDLISAGRLGRIVSFRGAFLQDWGLDPGIPRSWKFQQKRAGAGPLLSLGCHIVDLAHFLVGEITEVVGAVHTEITERPLPTGRNTYAASEGAGTAPVDIEDAGNMLVRFGGGAFGTIELSRVTAGRKNHCFLEVSGTEGALLFDYEHLNEIMLSTHDTEGRGFTRVIIGPEQDGGLVWTLGGLGVGFAETIVVHMRDFVAAIAGDEIPTLPTFADGVRAQEVIDSVLRSVGSGGWETVAAT